MLSINFRMAVSSLSAHKLRAILAMLGVFLGALAFTGVQHVSKIMVRQAEMETEKLGPNLYAVVVSLVLLLSQPKLTHYLRNPYSG